MSAKFRNLSASVRSRVASSLDLLQALKRASPLLKTKIVGLASPEATSLPPQAPPFLAGLPPIGAVYEPQQPATQELKAIIEENYYGTFFENAIKVVSAENIPELDRIKTLDQFYYYVDALVTWIPEIRVWDWDGERLHERTVYLRITQFYYYFNQPQLEALQSPIMPLTGAKLSPISRWLRDFAVEWGQFLDTEASGKYLESFKYAREYSWQDYEKPPEEYKSFNAFLLEPLRTLMYSGLLPKLRTIE